MRLLEVVNAPWAILPAKLIEIADVYATHLRGDKMDLAAVEARIGRPLANPDQGYDVVNGVAVVPINGVMAKRANLFSQVSGGASTELVGRDVRTAAEDPNVRAIILQIDSPGGAVDGTQQLADTIMAVRGIKPIVTLASGVMASAAYWAGSAADKVYIADGTTLVGCIGVVTTHVDVSAAESQRGVKTTEIYSGQYKRIASQYGALTDEGRATVQAQMDYLYSLFVGAVATQRGVDTDKVLSDMADGRVFIGQQAIDAGLADAVSSLDQLIADLSQTDRAPAARITRPKGTHAMNREELQAAAPELVQSLLAEGRTEGATAERERILGIEAHALPGHDALINELKADGKTTPDQAAARVLGAEKQKLSGMRQQIAADAPAPVPVSQPVAAPVKLTAREAANRVTAMVNAAQARGETLTYAQAAARVAEGA